MTEFKTLDEAKAEITRLQEYVQETLFGLTTVALKACDLINAELGVSKDMYQIYQDASGMVDYQEHNGAEWSSLFFGPAHLLPSFLLAPRA